MDGNDPTSGQIKYILVMDGDVNERFTMSMLLQRFGYTVCSASTVREAVEFLCVAPAVAVFAEAGEAGSELSAQLGADARFREMPLVLVSESSDGGLERRVREGALAGTLKKPLNPDQVFSVIQKVIENGVRRSIRVATALPAVLKDGENAKEAFVTVLSQYGLFVRTLDPRPVNDQVSLDVVLWDRTVSVEAKVLYVVSFEEGPFREPGMGMKFLKICAEDSLLVRAFIMEHIAEGIMPLDNGQSYRAGIA